MNLHGYVLFLVFYLTNQGEPIDTTEQRCLDTSLTILPEKLKELGYATHAVGK